VHGFDEQQSPTAPERLTDAFEYRLVRGHLVVGIVNYRRVQLGRQAGIINGAENNFHVLDVLAVGALPQFGEGLLVDVFCDNATARHDGARNGYSEEAFAGTDIGNDGTRTRAENFEHVVNAMESFKFGV
jgi:hypothetical protein